MKILYLNHTSQVSGAERSLLELLTGLPVSVDKLLAIPRGPLQRAAASRGLPTAPITGTAGSLRMHPLHTPRALAELTAASLQLRRLARRHRAQIIHANSIRAGLVASLAREPRRATIVHVRDCLPAGMVSSVTLRVLAASSTMIVANSRYTADSVRSRAPHARIAVVHNPVDLERWDPGRITRSTARVRLGDRLRDRLLLGVVAQLTPWKGQDLAIEALAGLRLRGIDAHLLLIGSAKFTDRATRFDNSAYVRRLNALAVSLGVADRVSLLGEREDIVELVRALDVLLLPSWEEPFGRALLEAMALGVPVVATNVGGPVEIVRDGCEGWLLPPRDADAWTAAIQRLHDDPHSASAMGAAGRRRVRQAFTLQRHVSQMLEVYERASDGLRR